MVGDVIAGRYELDELVGSGGMSSVYKAHDRLLERDVALKVLHSHFLEDEEYVERFRREARAVAQLSHPNIVTVIDRGESDGRQFIVFEYVDGESLKELVQRVGPLPARRAVEIAVAVADGLAFAHANGLVHRDVKPQNVLLNREGSAKVTDFGIARSLDVDHGMTQTGTVMGSGYYLSPEQANGKPVTPATDVYSLGVVLYELLIGDVPFRGDNVVAVAMRHVHEQPPNVLERRPDVPLRLAAAVERALEKDPARRFPSMQAFAAELRACLDELGAFDLERTFVARSPVLRESPPRRARVRPRRRLLYALLTLAAAAAILAGVLALGGSKPQSERTTSGGGSGRPVALTGATAFDPYGDNKQEHNDEAPNATDHNSATYWETEHYNDGLQKPGVGLVLDAGRPVALKSLTVSSDTPGYTASIRAGSSESGPFSADSSSREIGSRTTFQLDGHAGRYFVVWITDLGDHDSVHVNEVSARS